jgi:dihydrofolate reductase
VRRIINSTFISLDGVIENPQDWPASEVEDDAGTVIQTELLFACDAVLMGRRTYEGFAPVWTTRSGDPFSDRINSMAKYVVSSTLTEPDWTNTTVISGDPVAEIERLKAEPGMNIVQYGFGQLSYALMEHGLLDELRLWVYPFFVGSGGPEDLLYRDSHVTRFTLADTTVLKSGVVVLTYELSKGQNGKSS